MRQVVPQVTRIPVLISALADGGDRTVPMARDFSFDRGVTSA
jgi:hypothetical protein